MRLLISAAVFSLCLTGPAPGAAREAAGSAFSAARLLPKGEGKRIVRIEARDGTPAPERWHIIVHDPKDENGVHEYVIAGGEVVASRAISQFVESAKADDVMKESLLKVDSDKVAALAQSYAAANNAAIAALHYELKKEGAEAAPLWKVTCLDETGKELGQLVVSAGKGSVISHEGFTAAPTVKELVRAETQAETEAEREERRRAPRRPVVRAVPVTPAPGPAEKKDFFGRVGNSLNKIFNNKDANPR